MEKTLKIWQAFVALIGVFITVVTMIVNQSNKIETQRLRIEFLESTSRDHALMIKDIITKNTQDYNEIKNKLADILIMMQNKQDRGKMQ